MIDPTPCARMLDSTVHGERHHPDSTGLSTVKIFSRFYAEAVPDISQVELDACLDTYVLPVVDEAVQGEVGPGCNAIEVCRTIGQVAVAQAQPPHPSLYEPLMNFMQAYENSGHSTDTTAQEVARVIGTRHELVGLYTTIGAFENDMDFAFKLDDVSQSYSTNLCRVIDALTQTTALKPDQKREAIVTLIQEVSDIDAPFDWWELNTYRKLFSTLYDLDPIAAIQPAETAQQRAGLLLGMLANGHIPPKALLARVLPVVKEDSFVIYGIVDAYTNAGDLETAHQLLSAHGGQNQYRRSEQLEALANIAVKAINHTDNSGVNPTLTSLLREFIRLEQDTDYIQSMRPYALIHDALIECGQPETLAAFTQFRGNTRSHEARAEDYVKAAIFAGNVENAIVISMSSEANAKKAANFYSGAVALYQHSAGDPGAWDQITELCDMAYTYAKKAGREDSAIFAVYESLLHQAIDAQDYTFGSYLEGLIRAKKPNSKQRAQLSYTAQKGYLDYDLYVGNYEKASQRAKKQGDLRGMAKAVGLGIRAAHTAGLLG